MFFLLEHARFLGMNPKSYRINARMADCGKPAARVTDTDRRCHYRHWDQYQTSWQRTTGSEETMLSDNRTLGLIDLAVKVREAIS